MTIDISVILTFYNQSLDSLEKSVKSVSIQEGCVYELIITDDHSDIDPTDSIIALCKEYEIANLQVIRHSENLQTVGNIMHALDYASGPYIKVFTAGDELYGERTLADIVDFMKQNDADAGFGLVVKDSDGRVFGAPRNAREYPLPHSTSRKNLFKHQALVADWIPAGAQFFKRSLFVDLIETLYMDYGVRYCEDFAGLLALTKGDVYHLPLTVLLYEVGTGISTSGSLESRKKMYNDNANLYKSLREFRPFGCHFIFASALFELRRFIALKSPFYRAFQKLAMLLYSRKN